VHREVALPIMGMGGISGTEDALEFLLAGSTAVQVGTANFFDPRATVTIAAGIAAWCRREGVARVRDLVGALRVPEGPPPGPCAG
jgi:dihydroorotate dehydrogenase (NAD+) catalytic subunit